MIPVLIKLSFETTWSQVLLYLAALGVVGYLGYSGWQGAEKGKEAGRAALYALIGAGLAGVGLHYALPRGVFLGEKGMGIPIHTYGLMLASGFISAVVLTSRLAEKEWLGAEGPKKRDQIFDLAFYVLIAALVGSRVMFVIANLRDYLADPRKFFDLGGGLVFYGGLLGAMGVSIWYARKTQMDFMRLADCAIPTVSLGQAFGRLGCFSAGCCWGGPAPKSPIAVQFPDGTTAKTLFGNIVNTPSLAWESMSTDGRWIDPATGQITHQAMPGMVKMSEWVVQHHHTFLIWPTQLMESVGQFSLLLLFLFLRRYRRFHGQILGMWLMAYACLRTFVELFRGDTERGTFKHALETVGMSSFAEHVPLEAWWNISLGQFISLCMFTLGASILVRRGRGKLFKPVELPAGFVAA